MKGQPSWQQDTHISGGCGPVHPDTLPPLHFLPAPIAASSRAGLRAGSGRLLRSPEHCWASWAWTAACRVSRELTPLEEASLQNQKLKAAYEARMARLDPSQALQKTSLVSRSQGGSVLLGEGSRPYSPLPS